VSRKSTRILILTAIAVVVIAALFLTVGGGAVRALIALPAALILPGLVLTAAAFPAGRLGRAERILFSLGLSLIVITLGGFVLHYTPWGLSPTSWTILLGGVVLVGGGVAALRGRGGKRPLARQRSPLGLSGAQVVLCGLTVLIMAGALTLTVRGAEGQSSVGFTQLWMIDGTTPDAPTLQLGVTNQEPAATSFLLQLQVNQIVQETRTLNLEPGQSWGETITLPADLSATATVQAVLYREDNPGIVYRRVQLQRGQR
jgi:uncharacterized membrane protein